MKNLKKFNEELDPMGSWNTKHPDNKNEVTDEYKELSLLKGRILGLQQDLHKIDLPTIDGRLSAIYHQVNRLLDKL